MDPSPATSARTNWVSLIGQTLRASATDRVSLAAAGCAFYATLSLFPAISMLIAVYGMVLQPATAEQHLSALSGLLPGPAFALISARVHDLVQQTSQSLSLRLAASFLVTFWSSATGTKSLLAAVNIAYGGKLQRSILAFQAIGLSMTLLAVLCAILAIAVLLVLPQAIDFLGLDTYGLQMIHAAGMAMLIGSFCGAIALLYRYGPCRPPAQHHCIAPGAALATALWLAASEALSFYVASIASFDATYGPLGAVAGIMLWFYLSAYAILLGAELNARLETNGT